jgi:chalcone synthase
MFGINHALAKLLGLKAPMKHVMMMPQTRYFGGTSVLGVTKDLSKNNKDARILEVPSKETIVTYLAPSENHLDGLVGSTLFDGGAGMYGVGSGPKLEIEKSLFEVQ